MEKSCYRCSASISEDAPFCPACGAPQIRVSSQFESPAPEPGTFPEPPAGVPAGLGAAPRPGEIQWKIFLRTAWPLAVMAGLTSGFLHGFGLLISLPLSVVVGSWLYRKHHVGTLRAGQGAKLGMAMGMISFVTFASLTVIAVATSATVRQELVQSVNLAAARNPDPQAQQIMRNLVNTPQGFALLIGMGLFFAMVVFVVFTAISGAVAASTLGSKNP